MYSSLDFDVFQFNMMSEERPELSGKWRIAGKLF